MGRRDTHSEAYWDDARRYHRATLSAMRFTALALADDCHHFDRQAMSNRAAACTWALRVTDEPPTTTDDGAAHLIVLERWRQSLEGALGHPSIVGSTSRERLVRQRLAAIDWLADEVLP